MSSKLLRMLFQIKKLLKTFKTLTTFCLSKDYFLMT